MGYMTAKHMAATRIAALAAALLCGFWHAPALAVDLVRVETLNGQVLQGRLLGNTARELLLEIPGIRQPVSVARADIRRFSVIAPQTPAPPGARAERLAAAERTGALRISGSNSMGTKLLPALLVGFGLEAGLSGAQEEVTTDPAVRVFQLQGAESSRRLRVQLVSHGSASAFTDLAGGQADIGMSTRRATDAEARTMQLVGGQRIGNEHVVGLSGVAIIVHSANPIQAMSIEQLRDILSGATTRWPVTGGNGLPVTIYALDRQDGEFSAIQDRILGPGVRIAPQARIFESHEDLADAVAADPSGVGFVGTAYVRNTRALRLEQDCGVGGDPTAFNQITEEYPLSRRLYLYTTVKAAPLARDLVAYADSARGQRVVGEAGFGNLDPLLASAEISAAQLAAAGRFLPDDVRGLAMPQIEALRRNLSSARRLSVTFRFEGGRADLDPRAESDLNRLVQWVRRTGTREASLALIGHASIDGQFAVNVELSRARAQSVAARLRQMGVVVPLVEGVGPVNQVVCSRSVLEADMNRRVEVWVR